MSIQDETKKRNYRSRYEENRHCFRVDETTYVYRTYSGDGQQYFDERIHVGEDGVTLEILDFLQAADNAEAQDTEDERKNADGRFEGLLTGGTEDRNTIGFDAIGSCCDAFGGMTRSADNFAGSPELKGPEAALFPEEEVPGEFRQLFREVVLPELTDKEKDLIYSYYGAQMVAREIAEKTFKKNGKPLTESGITKQLRLLRAKVVALMEPYLD